PFSASKIALAFSDKSKQRKRARIKRIGQKRSPRQVLNRAKLAAAVRQLPFRQFIQRNWLPGGYKQTFLWVRNCQIVSSRVRDNKHSDKSKYEERKDADGRRQPLSRACRPIISAIANRSAARSANGIRRGSQRHSALYKPRPANPIAWQTPQSPPPPAMQRQQLRCRRAWRPA